MFAIGYRLRICDPNTLCGGLPLVVFARCLFEVTNAPEDVCYELQCFSTVCVDALGPDLTWFAVTYAPDSHLHFC